MLWWYSSATHLPTRTHKLFPEMTSASDVYGPFNLESWKELPVMAVAEKKAFWGKRRVAVGGRTIDADEDEDESGEDVEEDRVDIMCRVYLVYI